MTTAAQDQIRVTINGRFLDTTMTGVQRYAWEIVQAIDRLAAAGDAAASGMIFELARPANGTPPVPLRAVVERRLGRQGGYFWEQVTLPRMARGRRLLNLANVGPLAHSDAILCVHDAHVWLVPEAFSPTFRRYYRAVLPRLLRRSLQWTTVSRYSEAQLLRFGAAMRPADAVIGNAVGALPQLPPSAPWLPGATLPERYVFALGSAAAHKNFALLERIRPALAAAGLAVLIAGGDDRAIFARNDGAEMLRVGRVNDHELAWLYRNATCFVFPSRYEGFGIPPLEAMACDCPVVAAHSSALPEVLGDAPIWCAPDDADGWIDAVARLATDPVARAAAIERGRRQAALYSWEDGARRYLQLLRAGTKRSSAIRSSRSATMAQSSPAAAWRPASE